MRSRTVLNSGIILLPFWQRVLAAHSAFDDICIGNVTLTKASQWEVGLLQHIPCRPHQGLGDAGLSHRVAPAVLHHPLPGFLVCAGVLGQHQDLASLYQPIWYKALTVAKKWAPITGLWFF
jgi:hypothetical protein